MNIFRTPLRGATKPRLGVETLEPRCACSVGFVPPTHGPLHSDLPADAAIAPPPAIMAAPPVTAPATLVVTGPYLHLHVGERFNGVVAHVGGIGSQKAVADIDWGNGSTTPGNLMPDGDGDEFTFNVVGSGQFDQPGIFNMTVRVRPVGGDTIIIGGTAEVTARGAAASGISPDSFATQNQAPLEPVSEAAPAQAPIATTGTHTPGDTSGGIPWEQLADPRPAGQTVRQPVELPPVHPEAEAAKANAPPTEAQPTGPAYLVQAAHEPTIKLVIPPTTVLLDIIDVRAVRGGTVEPIDVLTPAGSPPTVETAAMPLPNAVVAYPLDPSTPAVEPQTRPPAKPKAESRQSPWRNGLAWCAAVIFAERTLAAWRGDRAAAKTMKAIEPLVIDGRETLAS